MFIVVSFGLDKITVLKLLLFSPPLFFFSPHNHECQQSVIIRQIDAAVVTPCPGSGWVNLRFACCWIVNSDITDILASAGHLRRDKQTRCARQPRGSATAAIAEHVAGSIGLRDLE